MAVLMSDPLQGRLGRSGELRGAWENRRASEHLPACADNEGWEGFRQMRSEVSALPTRALTYISLVILIFYRIHWDLQHPKCLLPVVTY